VAQFIERNSFQVVGRELRWCRERRERRTPDLFIAYCLAFAKAIAPGAVALWHDRTPQHLWKLDQSGERGRFPLAVR